MNNNRRKKRRLAGFGFSTAERYVGLQHYMLNSDAWKWLSPEAKAVLLEVWKRNNGLNNGEISYSVREAAEIHVSRTKAARALNECVELGFLVMMRGASFDMKTGARVDNGRARLWRLTGEKFNGEAATKDFMKWLPPAVVSAPAKSKTQSRRQDAPSHGRDAIAARASKTGPNSQKRPAGGTVSAQLDPKASCRRDISNIPGWGALAGDAPPPAWVRDLGQRPVGQYAELVARLTAAVTPPQPIASKKLAAARKRKNGSAQVSETVSRPLRTVGGMVH